MVLRCWEYDPITVLKGGRRMSLGCNEMVLGHWGEITGRNPKSFQTQKATDAHLCSCSMPLTVPATMLPLLDPATSTHSLAGPPAL